MEDKIRATTGILTTIAMLVVPLIAFLIGWQVWGVRAGILMAMGVFALFFLLSAFLFKGIKHPSVFLSFIPFILGMIYQVSPFDLPLPIDDSIVQLGGSLLSFMMLKRSNPELPNWTLLAMTASSLYDLIGWTIPGPIDELIVQLLALYGITLANRKAETARQLASGFQQLRSDKRQAGDHRQPGD